MRCKATNTHTHTSTGSVPDRDGIVLPSSATTKPIPSKPQSRLLEAAPWPQRIELNCFDAYAAKAKAVVIRHTSDHEVIAMVEIVSAGNKSSAGRLNSFVGKAEEVLAAGIHLLIVDLFPPSQRDPEGIHRLIWDGRPDEFVSGAAKPFTCESYIGDPIGSASRFKDPAAEPDERLRLLRKCATCPAHRQKPAGSRPAGTQFGRTNPDSWMGRDGLVWTCPLPDHSGSRFGRTIASNN
jgi:hypothetical protein